MLRMDRYEKAEFLGSGTFGHIYKVKSKWNGRNYVVKRVTLGSNTEEERSEAYHEVQVHIHGNISATSVSLTHLSANRKTLNHIIRKILEKII